MENDVFEKKEYLIYITNEQTKVDSIAHMLYSRVDFGDLHIVAHRICNGGKNYVWHIESWDAMFMSIKDSLRSLVHEGVCQMDDIKIVRDYKRGKA